MSKSDWLCRGLSRMELVRALLNCSCARPVVSLCVLFMRRSTLCELYVKYVSPFKS